MNDEVNRLMQDVSSYISAPELKLEIHGITSNKNDCADSTGNEGQLKLPS